MRQIYPWAPKQGMVMARKQARGYRWLKALSPAADKQMHVGTRRKGNIFTPSCPMSGWNRTLCKASLHYFSSVPKTKNCLWCLLCERILAVLLVLLMLNSNINNNKTIKESESDTVRIAKFQIFYTDQIVKPDFTPKKSAQIATSLALQTYKTELRRFLVMNKCR